MKTKALARRWCWLLLPMLLLFAGCADKKKQAADLLESARNNLAKGNNDAALADCSKAIELTPDDSQAYIKRSVVKFAKSDFAGAITDCSKAISLQPNDFSAYMMRASAEEAKADAVHALADWTQAIALHPIPEGYSQRGRLRHLTGDFSGAIDDYEKAQSEPDFLLRLRRYVLLRRLGRDPGSLDQTNAPVSAPWLRTIAHYLTGQMNEADFLTAADQGSPTDVAAQQCQAYYFIGEMHLINHDPAGARKFFSQSAALNETEADEYEFARAELTLLDKPPATVPGQSASPALNSLIDNSPYGENYGPGPTPPPAQ